MKNIHNRWRLAAANLLYKLASPETKSLVDADVRRYSSGDTPESNLAALDRVLLSGEKSFRSVFYYRLRDSKALCGLCRIFLSDIKEIELYGNLGAGVYLASSYMVVSPNSTGKNLHICSGVVVGKNGGRRPSIGDNVYIGAHSTVIGGVNVGDNVVIEAGSVVTKDIPPNTVYGGNPARFIRENTVCPEA